jgi:hypothetical protein
VWCWIFLTTRGVLAEIGSNQLWMADITYILLKAEFVYLAVTLEGLSLAIIQNGPKHFL